MRPTVTEKVSYGAQARYTPSSFLTETIGGKKIAHNGANLNVILAKPPVDPAGYHLGDTTDRFFVWNNEHKPWAMDGSKVAKEERGQKK